MDPKTWLDFGLGALQTLAWPTIAIVGICVFRSEIRALLSNLTSAKAWGIEANFLARELEDPQNSDEVKDAFAQLWRDVALINGQPVPQQAAEQLSSAKRRRGRPASQAVIEALDDKEYVTHVREALARVSDGRLTFGMQLSVGLGTQVFVPNFALEAEHGAARCSVFVRSKPVGDHLLAGLKEDPPSSARPDILVVTRIPFELPNIRTVCWRSAQDDEQLADALEAAELFDYVEDPK